MSAPFRLDEALPDSSLVIQASAGTGKTYTLAALAVRHIAERDVRAAELLVVTFTRAATTELRARLRERIAEAASFLARLEPGDDGVAAAEGDVLLAHLAGLADRRRAAANLGRAVTEFDAATVSTIHGFAAQVLGLLGLDADDESGLADDTDALTLSVCADVLAGEAAAGTPADLLPTYVELARTTQVLLERPGLVLTPDPDPEVVGAELAEAAAVRRRLAERCVAQVGEQRRRVGARSFGDLLTLLQAELLSDRAGVAAHLVRSRYRVALIDEFQDTDPVQWDIFRTLFGGPDDHGDGTGLESANRVGAGPAGEGGRLVLVGDPKQAIYAFRGADIHTYLRAVEAQPEARSLTTNWRSDGAALAAVDALFDGVAFGDDRIAFQPVQPGGDPRTRRLRRSDGSARPGLQIRHRSATGLATTTRKVGVEPAVQTDDARREIVRDLVGTIIELLGDTRLPVEGASDGAAGDPAGGDGSTGDGGATRPLRPGDVAVLVRNTKDAETIRDELVTHGVPAVLARGRSVLESAAAEQWRWLLEAVARPADVRRARTFALSWFAGHDARWLDGADDRAITEVQDRLVDWAAALRDDGLEAFLRRVLRESDVIARVLGRADGERHATDLEHVAELFRTDRPAGRVSVAGLLAVLDGGQVNGVQVNPNADYEGDPSSRRVATEADAVQIMTVWVAKGLEFPVVCCPTLWARGATGDPTIYLDEAGRRSIDLLPRHPWPDKGSRTRRDLLSTRERDGEALRLLYVALTRARHQTVLWWTRAEGCQRTALGRVLFGRRLDGSFDPAVLPDADGVVASEAVVPPEADCGPALDRLAARATAAADLPEPVLEVVTLDAVAEPARWQPEAVAGEQPELALARLDHLPERRRARWSFSSIVARAGDLHDNVDATGEGPDLDGDADRADRSAGAGPAAPATAAPPVGVAPEPGDEAAIRDRLAAPDVSPLAPLPAGAAFGLLVHSLYEHVDFTDDDLDAALDDRLGRELDWRDLDLTPQLLAGATHAAGRRRVVEGVAASLRTPLGTDLGDRRLADVGRGDRLDELDFELHLAPGATVTDRALGRVLAAHLPATDPFRAWADQLAAGTFDVDLAGHLTGSIDLVLRVRDAGRPDRFVVVDYKTNRLHDPTAPPPPGAYGPEAMAAEMAHAHYPLQALLYSVALHRYLRWRLPGYDPAANLGGARYLFVRGMAGPGTERRDGRPDGVCCWDLPPAAVVAVSDLLAGAPLDQALALAPDPTGGGAADRGLTDDGATGSAHQPSLFDPAPGAPDEEARP